MGSSQISSASIGSQVVGAGVGFPVGEAVGARVGLPVGADVGLPVGDPVGAEVGLAVVGAVLG